MNELIIKKYVYRNKCNCCDYLQLVRNNIKNKTYGVLTR